MVDHILELLGRVGSWSYALIFVAATLESSAFVGLFVPGDTIAVIAGFLVWQGVLDLPETIAVAAAGAIVGDSIGYELGRRLGRPWLLRHGDRFGLHRHRLQRLDDLFERHGGKTVLFSRFIAFLRALAPFVAGSSRMPYLRFLAFNVVGAVLWAVAFVSLGYVLGVSWRIAEQWIGRVGAVAGAVAITIGHLAPPAARPAAAHAHPLAWRRRYRVLSAGSAVLICSRRALICRRASAWIGTRSSTR